MASKTSSGFNLLLVTSLGILLFIAGSIAGFFIWKSVEQNTRTQPPAYVDLGKVVAQVGGGYFIRTGVQLEVKNDETMKLIKSRENSIRQVVQNGFSSAPGHDIYSPESKLLMQEAIMSHLNQHLGRPAVRAVYFSDFLVSAG